MDHTSFQSASISPDYVTAGKACIAELGGEDGNMLARGLRQVRGTVALLQDCEAVGDISRNKHATRDNPTQLPFSANGFGSRKE